MLKIKKYLKNTLELSFFKEYFYLRKHGERVFY